jgi:Core-2/I-Branching enzyme
MLFVRRRFALWMLLHPQIFAYELEENKLDFPLDLDQKTPADSASIALDIVGQSLRSRLETELFAKAKTAECRAKIAEHLGYFLNAIGTETNLPFSDVEFPNECGEAVYEDWNNLPEDVHVGMIQNRTYQPPANETVVYPDPETMTLLYAILTHENPAATIRLVEALQESQQQHQFVVHVDAKYDETQRVLLEYASDKQHFVHILDDPYRVRVNWGGFSMVNATLQTFHYAFGLTSQTNSNPLVFDKVVHLSSSSYPLASNPEIRHTLAAFPSDANFLNIIMRPNRPAPQHWHYFIECDDALHRIYQLPVLRNDVCGIDLYTSSQWFIASREFAEYLANAESGSLVEQYLQYVEHVVVADETFFGTVLRHTKFCHKHHNRNFLHLQFDRWESELPSERRDSRKCPMPDPDHCGRSPTTMTLDYVDIMELSDNLFARKVWFL